MSFVSTLLGVCSGTGVFPELAKRSLWRAAWHFLLMSVLCALIIAAGGQHRIAGTISSVYGRLTASYGELSDSGFGGLNVEKNNQAPSTVLLNLTPPAAFCYLPSASDKLPEDFSSNADYGFIASPTRLVFWMKSPAGMVFALPPQPSERLALSRENAERLLASPTPSEKIPPEHSTAAALLGMMKSPGMFVFCFTAISAFAAVIILALPVLLLFSLVFGWFGSQRSKNLVTLRDTFVIDTYAGFPAMLVAAVFPALDIKYLDFNLVYSLGLVVYATIAVNRVVLSRLPAKTTVPKE